MILNVGWGKSTTSNGSLKVEHLVFCKLHTSCNAPCSPPVVSVSLQVFCDFTWSAFLYGKKLDPISTPLIKDMPVKLTNVQHISQFLTTIDFNTSFLKLWYIIIHIRENQDVGSFFRRNFDF